MGLPEMVTTDCECASVWFDVVNESATCEDETQRGISRSIDNSGTRRIRMVSMAGSSVIGTISAPGFDTLDGWLTPDFSSMKCSSNDYDIFNSTVLAYQIKIEKCAAIQFESSCRVTSCTLPFVDTRSKDK